MIEFSKNLNQKGLSESYKVKRKISEEDQIQLDDIIVPSNAATKLVELSS